MDPAEMNQREDPQANHPQSSPVPERRHPGGNHVKAGADAGAPTRSAAVPAATATSQTQSPAFQ